MAPVAILFGALLTALGAVAYGAPEMLGSEKAGGGSPTAAIPAFIGFPILLSGLLTVAFPTARKHAMHVAAMFGLLGAIGGFVPMVRASFDFNATSVKVGLGMTLLCGLFVFLCVRSFIAARKAREAAAAATAV